MLHQLLWLETLLKLSAGIVLVLFPISTSRLLGLPHANVGFWPRLVGVLLIGLAGAIYLEGSHLLQLKHGGLGVAGLAFINLVGILGLLGAIIMRLVKTTRGLVSLWALVAVLVVLVLVELAVA